MLDRIFEAVADDPDLEWLAIDATVIRAQAQAAGARVKRGRTSPDARAIRRRVRHQNPRRSRRSGPAPALHPRPYQQNDMAPACDLIVGLRRARFWLIAPMTPTACTISSTAKTASRSSRHAAIANINTATTVSPTNSDGASKASSPSSSNGDASLPATTKSPTTSSASSNSPASCSGSND